MLVLHLGFSCHASVYLATSMDSGIFLCRKLPNGSCWAMSWGQHGGGRGQKDGLLLHNLPLTMVSLGWWQLFWGKKEVLCAQQYCPVPQPNSASLGLQTVRSWIPWEGGWEVGVAVLVSPSCVCLSMLNTLQRRKRSCWMWPLGFGSPTERTSLLLVCTLGEPKGNYYNLDIPNKAVPTNMTSFPFIRVWNVLHLID